jgi:7-cyano-7-deazaguanine reductase
MRYGEKAIRESTALEVWVNPYPDRDYEVDIEFPEFTCLCPRSGYPDFATIGIVYVPDHSIVELKSLKLHLNSYRDEQISHEAAVNRIYDTLKTTLAPRYLEVTGNFNPRGNVSTIVRVGSRRDDD